MKVLKNRKKQIQILILTVLILVTSIPRFSSLSASVLQNRSLEEQYVFEEVQETRGDTLWTIAQTYGPTCIDLRKTVHVIKQKNRLSKAVIHPGDKLLVPIEVRTQTR